MPSFDSKSAIELLASCCPLFPEETRGKSAEEISRMIRANHLEAVAKYPYLWTTLHAAVAHIARYEARIAELEKRLEERGE